MSTSHGNTTRKLSRRGVLSALGAAIPAAVAAQTRPQVSTDTMKACTSLTGTPLADQRYAPLQTPLQRDIAQFQIVRDLELDFLIEPTAIFAVPRS